MSCKAGLSRALFFPPLDELSRDPGPIGDVLRKVPTWAIREADRVAEEVHEAQGKRQEPGRLPWPNPWKFLIEAPAASETQKAVFRAAQSQIAAVRHVIGMGFGRATLHRDWYEEVLKAETKDRAEHAKQKLADAMAPYEKVQRVIRQDQPELIEQMNWLLKKRRAKLVHRGERDRTQTKRFPTWKEIRESFPLATILVEWWVTIGDRGLPGLMFWRNAAITKLLIRLTGKEGIFAEFGRDTVKKTRQRLGLVPVDDKAHLVWDISVTRCADGRWDIKGRQRNGNEVFGAILQLRKPS